MPTLDTYTSLTPRRRSDIDYAIYCSKQRDTRKRTVVAIEVQPGTEDVKSRAILFYVLVGEKEVEPVLIIDLNGRRVSVPYEQCRTWDRLTKTLSQSTTSIPISWNALDFTHNGSVIPSRTWESIIKPGMTIEIRDSRNYNPHMHRPYYSRKPPLGSLPPGLGAPPRLKIEVIEIAPPRLQLPGTRPGFPPPPAGKRDVLTWMKGMKKHLKGTGDDSSDDDDEEEKEKEKESQGSELKRLGLGFDWKAELEKTKKRPEEMLRLWTNAPDPEGGLDDGYLSDTNVTSNSSSTSI